MRRGIIINYNIEDEEKLFKEWKEQLFQDTIFVRDGLINPNKYFNSPVKILFLLKDAHSQKDEFQLLKGLREEGNYAQGQTWIRACKWIDGLINLYADNRKDFESCRKEYSRIGGLNYQHKYLQYIALVNVNKNGSSTIFSDNDKVKLDGNKYSQLLMKQINLYDPDIIIIGNKGYLTDVYKEAINKEFEYSYTINDSDFYINGKKLVISTKHPSISKNNTYNDIIDGVDKFIKNYKN